MNKKNGSILITTIIFLFLISILMLLYLDKSITNIEISDLENNSYQDYLYAHSYILHMIDERKEDLWKLYWDNYYVISDSGKNVRFNVQNYIHKKIPEIIYYPGKSTNMSFALNYKDGRAFYNVKISMLEHIFSNKEPIISDNSDNEYQDDKLRVIQKIFSNPALADQRKFNIIILENGNYTVRWIGKRTIQIEDNNGRIIFKDKESKPYYFIYMNSSDGSLVFESDNYNNTFTGFILSKSDLSFMDNFTLNGLIATSNCNILGKHKFFGEGKVLVDGICEMARGELKAGDSRNRIVSYLKNLWVFDIIYFKR